MFRESVSGGTAASLSADQIHRYTDRDSHQVTASYTFRESVSGGTAASLPAGQIHRYTDRENQTASSTFNESMYGVQHRLLTVRYKKDGILRKIKMKAIYACPF